MAEEFIAEAVMTVLTALLSRVADELCMVSNIKGDLKKLEDKLKRIHMLLSGAAQQTLHNPLVNDWISKVKYIAYEADDLLDEVAYEALKRRLKFRHQSRLRTKLRFFFMVDSNPILFRFQMGHRVRHLMGSIEGVFSDAQVLGIKPVDIAAGFCSNVPVLEDVQLQVQRELVSDQGLIGRDQDEANIVRMLRHHENANRHLTVLGIVGMAGLGKTALSKRAYKGREVCRHFEHRIWVCVSHDFELKGILEKMVELVDEQSSARSSYQALVGKLENNLRGKRYLLVLDDVWDTMLSVWESFRSILMDIGGSKGTVVLATSRSYQVIESMQLKDEVQPVPVGSRHLIYNLKSLNFNDSWSLFQRRVHNIRDGTSAKRMVTKCGGIPLAISMLGDLLRNRCLEVWKEIEESEIWKLEDKNGILPSLRLSFNYLPSAAIKSCFAYCAIFPEDAVISRECLIQLWMAQGFLQPYGKMEHVGNEYFNILLNNSFFQEAEVNKKGRVDYCKMHDVVHALAKAVAGQECWALPENVNITDIPSEVRHLSLLTEKSLTLKVKEKVRSVISESLYIGKLNNLLTHGKYLRVLSLVRAGLSKLPASIGCFKHLRYLDISYNEIMELPSTICELYNLQTLRHLCSRFRYISTYPTLPKQFGKLSNLRYISTSGYSFMDFSLCILLEATPRMSHMFDQHQKWGVKISDISSLNNIIGSLAVLYLEHISSREEVRKANMKAKENVQHLDLTWSYNATCQINPEEVFQELQPHQNLKNLSIWYYNGSGLPSWLTEMRLSRESQLCNLVELKFYYCCKLKHLPTFICSSLKVLVVWGCDSLRSFPDMNGMGSLEKLQIGRCPIIQYLPSLEPLPNLRSLEIHNCSRMTSMPLGIGSFHNLIELEIGPLCQELDCFPFPDIDDSSPLTKCLQKLGLKGWSDLESLPNQVRHLTRLQTLSISGFGCLETLPYWLGNLPCLELVHLWQMKNLTCLPSRNVMKRATSFLGFRSESFHCPKLCNSDFLSAMGL